MNTSTAPPVQKSSLNPDQIVQALVRSRNEIRKFRRNLIVADEGCGPMLLIAVFQTCFERALNGVHTRGEDLKRMLQVFFGPPARD